MGNKKLDEFFQEKFNDFEELPDDKVWDAIEASLDKKKRRIIPLWWKFTGAAAILIIGLLVIYPFTDVANGVPILTNVQKNTTDSVLLPRDEKTKILKALGGEKNQISQETSEEARKNVVESSARTTSKNKSAATKKIKERSAIVTNQERRGLTTMGQENSEQGDTQAKAQIADVRNSVSKKDKVLTGHGEQIIINSWQGVVDDDDSPETISGLAGDPIVVRQAETSSLSAVGKEIFSNGVLNTQIARKNSERSDIKIESGTGESVQKTSIFNEIDAKGKEATAKGIPEKKWSAGPSIAPVYFNAFGEGSPVNAILASNAKSGNTNLSYGLTVSYAVNDRLSVRSGVHKVNYGYDTGDVEFSSSLDGSITDGIANIDYATTARDLVVRSSVGSLVDSANDNGGIQATDVSSASTSVSRNGSMSQQFGYLEVPVELNYALVDRKVGIHFIGGFSSLFLINNSVTLASGAEITEMGEARNLNDVNFSTNIGLGFDYNFSPRIKLTFDPLFKYQLNTFSDVDGSFNPFSIGVYSGLSFWF